MITPRTLRLRVDRRRAVRILFRVKGYDLTSATYRAQVRLYPDAPGDPILDLPKVNDTSNGLLFLSVETVDGAPISLLQMQVSPATMASGAIPAAPPGDDSITLSWDLNLTPPGQVEAVYVRGPFQIDGVVTQ